MLTLINCSLTACLNELARCFFVLRIGEGFSLLSSLPLPNGTLFLSPFLPFLPFLFGHRRQLRPATTRRSTANELKSQWNNFPVRLRWRVYLPGERFTSYHRFLNEAIVLQPSREKKCSRAVYLFL